MAEPSDDPITSLAFAAKAGDRAAAAAFIRLTQSGLQRFLSLLADRGDVEDLAQETYLRAMPALARFDGRSTAQTWLYAIARRVAADHIRQARRRPRTAPLDHLDEADHRAPASRLDEAVAMRDLLRTLDTDRREAFVLTQILRLSYDEAARVCGCPSGTIRSRVSRARDDLVTALRADDNQPVTALTWRSALDRLRRERGGGARRQAG